MSGRATELWKTADTPVAQLIVLISTADEAALRQPCPSREKLGDGTVAAVTTHTADNYRRIAEFVSISDRMSASPGHQMPRFVRATGDRASDPSSHRPGAHGDATQYTAEDANPSELAEHLTTARNELTQIADLTDRQLDTVPPEDSFRFCDGQRSLDQVLAALLKHQQNQVEAPAAKPRSQPVTERRGPSALVLSRSRRRYDSGVQ
jgi:hypothetical protein